MTAPPTTPPPTRSTPPAVSPPVPRPAAPMPMKARIGLAVSAVLLVTAIGLEIHGHSKREGIVTREVADPASEPLLQALPPGTQLPSPSLQPEAPMQPPFAGMKNQGLPPGHPGANVPPLPPGGTGEEPPETEESLIMRGREVSVRLKCLTCHSDDGRPGVSSTFKNLYGRQSLLNDGTKVTVTDAYLRESILDPQAKIVQGPTVAMPAYKGSVSERDIEALIAYIKSLSVAAKPE